MKVLVTGATGFIGRHVLQLLATRTDVEVRAVGRRRPAGIHTAQHVEWLTAGEVGPQTSWEDALVGVDAVLHLAARAHILERHPGVPADFEHTNVEGALTLYRAAQRARCGHFVFISTIGVNGNRTGGTPFSEESIPRPMEPYAKSKWLAEQGLTALRVGSSTALTIIRPPLVYGVGAPGNLGRLIRLVDKGWPLPIASIRNRRSFVSVANLCDFIAQVLTDPRARDQVFLISDGKDISTPDLVRALCRARKRPHRLWHFPVLALLAAAYVTGRIADFEKLAGDLRVDSSKARRLLEWQPVETLEQGIQSWVAGEPAR